MCDVYTQVWMYMHCIILYIVSTCKRPFGPLLLNKMKQTDTEKRHRAAYSRWHDWRVATYARTHLSVGVSTCRRHGTALYIYAGARPFLTIAMNFADTGVRMKYSRCHITITPTAAIAPSAYPDVRGWSRAQHCLSIPDIGCLSRLWRRSQVRATSLRTSPLWHNIFIGRAVWRQVPVTTFRPPTLCTFSSS